MRRRSQQGNGFGRWGLLVAMALVAAWLVPAPAGSATIPRIHAAELTAPAGVGSAYFGSSVAIFEDTLVVGSPYDGNGAVHVFERTPEGLWEHQQELRPPLSALNDRIGDSVAVYGGMIVAGAPGYDAATVDGGAIHVFVRDTAAGEWSWERTVSAGPTGSELGTSVAVSGGWVVAGAPYEDGTGRVHVWRRPDWKEQTLPALGVDAGGSLGWSVAIDGDLIVAGAPFDDAGGTYRGSAHLYLFDTQPDPPDWEWIYWQELTAPLNDGDRFGMSVAMDLPDIVVGVPSGGAGNRGAVHVFRPGGGTTWEFAGELVAFDGEDGDQLGWSVAIEGDEVFAGAPRDGSRAGYAGAVSVFDLGNFGFRAAELTDPSGAQGDLLGTSVAADGGVVVTGAPYDDGRASNAGAALVFADLPDSLLCGGVAATLVGTAGGDTLTGTQGRDVIRGYGGDDTITGFGGNDIICGDGGDDLLLGGPGDDTLYGGDGNDKLRGAAGDDLLFGDAGSDRLLPETGNDTAVGGAGSDIVDYLTGDGPIHADLALGTVTYLPPGGPWTHTLVTVEKVDGSRYADTIRGDSKRNVLRGKQGVDRIWGGGGDDDLIGGTGDDDVYGGDGDDLIKGQADDDLLEGETGADTIRGGNGNDTLRGGAGDDLLIGGLIRHRGVFANVIDGGSGADVCRWWFDHPINCP